MRVTALSLTFILSVLSTVPAHADFRCSGSVTHLGTNLNGELYVRLESYPVLVICNVATSFTANGVTVAPELCRTWYASLLAAQKAGDPAVFSFMSASVSGLNPSACTLPTSWAVPNPLPFHLAVTPP